MSAQPHVRELLDNPEALLTSTHLAQLGHNRRSIDAVWRGCPTVHLPGYSRPMVTVRDYLAFVRQHTFRDDRVLPR